MDQDEAAIVGRRDSIVCNVCEPPARVDGTDHAARLRFMYEHTALHDDVFGPPRPDERGA